MLSIEQEQEQGNTQHTEVDNEEGEVADEVEDEVKLYIAMRNGWHQADQAPLLQD